MKKLKLIDYKDLYEQVTPERMLVLLYDNCVLYMFYRSIKDNEVHVYFNLFSTRKVSDIIDGVIMTHENSCIDEDKVIPVFVGYDMFLALKRREMIGDINRNETDKIRGSNYFRIKDDISRDGGKIVSFSYDNPSDPMKDAGLLIGATSTDEDYYFWYIDSHKNLCQTTCLSKYKVIKENSGLLTREWAKLLKLEKSQIRYVVDKLFNKLLTTFDVFFTPIHINGMTNEDLTLFKQYSLLYSENRR